MSTLGQNLRSIQQQRGISTKALAEQIGVSPSVVSGWRRDKRGLPETPTLFKLAKALDCSVESLLAGIDDEYDARAMERLEPLLVKLGVHEELERQIRIARRRGVLELSDDERERLYRGQADVDDVDSDITYAIFREESLKGSNAQVLDERIEFLSKLAARIPAGEDMPPATPLTGTEEAILQMFRALSDEEKQLVWTLLMGIDAIAEIRLRGRLVLSGTYASREASESTHRNYLSSEYDKFRRKLRRQWRAGDDD